MADKYEVYQGESCDDWRERLGFPDISFYRSLYQRDKYSRGLMEKGEETDYRRESGTPEFKPSPRETREAEEKESRKPGRGRAAETNSTTGQIVEIFGRQCRVDVTITPI